MFRGFLPLVLPTRDAPNVDRVPVVTWTLMALQALALCVWAWPHYGYDAPVDGHARIEWARAMGLEVNEYDFIYATPGTPRPEPYTVFVFDEGYRAAEPVLSKLFRSLFIHAGLVAAALHLLLLWIFGDNVEHHIGRGPFALLYLGGGVVGAFLAAHVNPMGSVLPVLASTSALGTVIGAYFVFFRYNEVEVAYLLPRLRGLRAALADRKFFKARIVIIGCLWVFGLQSNLNLGARGATLVGFALGIGAALTLRKLFGPDESLTPHAWYPDALPVSVTPATRISRFLEGGRDGDAVQLYLETKHETGAQLDAASLGRIVAWLERHGAPALTEAARAHLEAARCGTIGRSGSQ